MPNRYLQLVKKPKILMRKIVHRVLKDSQKRKWLSFPDDAQIVAKLQRIVADSKQRTIFLFPAPSCPWGYMFQRPQQLARAIAANAYHVIYMVDTSFAEAPDWEVRGVLEIEKGIYLYNDGCNGKVLVDQLQEANVVVWQYWPHQTEFVSKLTPNFKIYDCIDHLTTFIPYSSIQEDFQASIRQADMVLASAATIHEEVRSFREDCLLVPNGVNISDFQTLEPSIPQKFVKIRHTSSILVGYYGAIASWFDFELVAWLADQNPQWTFLLVGEVYPEVAGYADALKSRRNVKVLPRVSYNEIPGLLSIMDVAFIPFVINEITINTSPVKVFEYMAGGKQTVTVDLPETRGLPGVYNAKNREQFQLLLQQAVADRQNHEVSHSLMRAAHAFSWTERIHDVIQIVNAKQGAGNNA